MNLKSISFFLILTFSSFQFLISDQPVMNEVPRWNGGYGFQIFQEYRWSNTIKKGTSELANSDNLFYQKHITHLEGVYTWRKWIRVTAKVPFVFYKYRLENSNGNIERKSKEGLNDVTLALPLKHYMNRKNWSGHFGFTPQIRFLGNSSGTDNKISDGSTDFGFSLGFEKETSLLKISGGATYWFEQNSGEKDEFRCDVGLGWNFHDRGFVGLELDYENQFENYEWLGAGISFFWNFNDLVMARLEYKHALYEYEKNSDVTRGNAIRFGIGFVF